MTTATQLPTTPGFDMHLEIWFSTDRKGRRIAQHFSRHTFRAARLPLADAEYFIATGQASQVAGHPFPARRTR